MKVLVSRAQRELSSAMVLASEAHMDQFDLAGEPYILHCVRIALKMTSPIAKTIAILHNVIKDTKATMEDLEELGFCRDILDAVETLTHLKGEHYEDYLKRVKKNKLATSVKIADLEDNMDVSRLRGFSCTDERRLSKYWHAYQDLRGGVSKPAQGKECVLTSTDWLTTGMHTGKK